MSGKRPEGGPSTQAASVEGDARCRLLAENSTDVITVTTPEGELRYVSPACRTLSGFEPDELVGRSGYDLVHPDDLARVAEAHANLLESELPFTSAPYRTLRKDGSYVWVESTVKPIRDPATGQVVEVQASARDVTARMETERRLRESEAMLARAEWLTSTGSWEWDLRSGEVIWSDELYAIFGHTREQFTPSYDRYLEQVVPEDRRRVDQLVQRSLNEHASFVYECTIEAADGQRRAIEAHGEVETDADGRARRMRGTAQDVTDRRRAQEELAGTHAELKRRTNELERSNLELEQFAYDISHDLAEPLRIMSRLSRTLGERYGSLLDDDGRQLVTSVVDGTERMKMLISDLLEYSRVSREPLERTWVDCEAAFEEAVELLSESIAEKGGSVTCGELPTIEASPAQFRQLLQNLLSNALKFSGESPLRVRVEATRQDESWRFSVADNGIGIDPGQAQRVFDLFRRLQHGDAFAGTGLGLSICKRIVERHGGRIWVEPGVEGGSVFLFTIPDRKTALEAVLAGDE